VLLPPSLRSRILLTTLALLVSGCGLSDYESKMLEQQHRLQRWDLENKYLGKPLDIKYPEKDFAPAVFLRAPREIGTSASEQLYGGLFAVFPRSGTGPCQSVCINVSTRDDLEKEVRALFRGAGQATTANRATQSEMGLRQLTWEDKEGNSNYFAFLHPATKPTVAVVYQYERGKNVQDQLSVSLDTLAIGDDAAKQRGEFSRHGKRK
jgi:hypothetical protein